MRELNERELAAVAAGETEGGCVDPLAGPGDGDRGGLLRPTGSTSTY